jgi:hypothetical protein
MAFTAANDQFVKFRIACDVLRAGRLVDGERVAAASKSFLVSIGDFGPAAISKNDGSIALEAYKLVARCSTFAVKSGVELVGNCIEEAGHRSALSVALTDVRRGSERGDKGPYKQEYLAGTSYHSGGRETSTGPWYQHKRNAKSVECD